MRALAALVVAFGHAQTFIGTSIKRAGRSFAQSRLPPCNAGVDPFVVFSGFILAHSSEKLCATPDAPHVKQA